jgi:hypothetical protein
MAQQEEAKQHSSQGTHEHPSGVSHPPTADTPTNAPSSACEQRREGSSDPSPPKGSLLPEPFVLPQHSRPSHRMRVRESYDRCAGNDKGIRISSKGRACRSGSEERPG